MTATWLIGDEEENRRVQAAPFCPRFARRSPARLLDRPEVPALNQHLGGGIGSPVSEIGEGNELPYDTKMSPLRNSALLDAGLFATTFENRFHRRSIISLI